MRRVLSPTLFMLLAAMAACTPDRIAGNPKRLTNQHSRADVAVSTVATPTVIGPIAATALPGDASHGYPFFSANVDLTSRGYVEQEFFIEGTANRYALPDRASATVIDGGHAYRTRIVVRRPASPANFNGTVVLEWQNVTAAADFDAVWLASHDNLMRRGFAWIGVSNQALGVQASPLSLRKWNPTRYQSLDVTAGGAFTADQLSYDIFSQAAQAVRQPTGVDPMGGLHVERIVAIGASQGANYLARYYNSIQPLAGVIDGFILISGGGLLRTDRAVPVMKVLTETDLVSTSTPQAPLRQPPTEYFRRWEVAGASHLFDQVMREYVLVRSRDLGTWSLPSCNKPGPSRIPLHYVANASLERMLSWLQRGTAPSVAPDIQIDLATKTVVRDADGNAMGGIRLSQLAVPTATNTGVNGPTTPVWCWLMGSYEPFASQRLNELYATHQDYVSKVIEATHAVERAGYIVGHDAAETIAAAARSNVGRRAQP